MADYKLLIDPEVWTFIDETNACYPPDTATRPIGEQRKIYDAMCHQFHAGIPPDVVRSENLSGGVPVCHYTKGGDGPIVLYFHGGGFVVGGLHSHDDICAEICDGTGLDVVSVDYRLAPEYVFPAALIDAYAAFDGVQAKFSRPIILAGDSAGGNLCAVLCAGTGRSTSILGQVLIYPGLGGDVDKGSYVTHADAPMLSRADVLTYDVLRRGDRQVAVQADFSPLKAQDFSGRPNTVAIGAECDPLADDARNYAAAITADGGKALWIEDKGLVHGHLRARHKSVRAGASFDRVKMSISLLANGQMPSNATLGI